MTNPTNTEPSLAEAADGKTKAVKTKETISFLSTAVPLLGVLGTGFVWAAANYYVGTVDVKPTGEYQDISIQVFDQKGVEQEFHTPHFLLQPGKYHMAINVDKKGVHHVDTEVKLGATSNIRVEEPKAPVDSSAQSSKEEHKHWWQVWKKSNSDKSDQSSSDKFTSDKSDKSNSDKSDAGKTTTNQTGENQRSATQTTSDNLSSEKATPLKLDNGPQ